MPIYKVGIMSDTKLIEAPNAKAAALFYGLNTRGNAQLMAAVYEEDGQPYQGERLPWAKHQLKGEGSDLLADIHEFGPQMKSCKFVEEA
jgi:hypothetical protein